MRVVYWARLQLARRQIVAALHAVPGADVTVVETRPICSPRCPARRR